MRIGEVEIEIVADAAAAAERAAELLAAVAVTGGAVALSGGSSPRLAYARAAALAPDWSRVDVWLGDERCVPPDDERANARLVAETLLAAVTAPPRTHLVDTSLDPQAAAAAYDAALDGVELTLALCGLGSDGHTASLFPHARSLDETRRRAVAAEAGLAPWVPRVTMTLPFLATATHVVFLAVGEDKAGPARRALVEPPSPATPASLLRAASGRTTAVLDAAAAALLP
jgi:6-phosphogluconolactonase